MLNNTNKSILILSGYNDRAVIAFCRFAISNNITFYIIARNSEDYIFLSLYKNFVISTRNSDSLEMEDFYSWKLKISSEEVIILPSAEYINRFLLKNNSNLNSMGYIIPLCPMSLYETISDKYTFTDICIKHDIPVPEEIYDLKNINLPFVAKPKKYFSKNGIPLKPIIIHRNDELESFLKQHIPEDFYYQKFIGGKSIYLLYYFPKNSSSFSAYSQENLIQQDGGLSIIAATSSDYHILPISTKFIKLFNKLHFWGLVMIEVKFHKGNFYMIEANPRLWGPSQLIMDAGMDIFYKFAFDMTLIHGTPAIEYKINTKYFWSGGIYKDNIHKKQIRFHNFTSNEFLSSYNSFIDSEVYLRDDTFDIFLKENRNEFH